MSEVCQFYINGCCKFGDRCRNAHPNQHGHHHHHNVLPSTKPSNTQGLGLENPESVLGLHWSQFMWKGTPLWRPGETEPTFRGLDVSIEELRWEFYKRPMNEWFEFQSMIDKTLESARLEWLRMNGRSDLVSSLMSEQVQPPNNFLQSTLQPTPLQNPGPIFSNPFQQSTPFQTTSVFSSTRPAQFNMPQTNQVQIPAQFNMPQTNQVQIPAQFNMQPHQGQISFNQNRTTLEPTEQFNTNSDGLPYSNFYPQAQDLKNKYSNELRDYEIWEIAAFLSPIFQNSNIPTKVPPSLPEFQ